MSKEELKGEPIEGLAAEVTSDYDYQGKEVHYLNGQGRSHSIS